VRAHRCTKWWENCWLEIAISATRQSFAASWSQRDSDGPRHRHISCTYRRLILCHDCVDYAVDTRTVVFLRFWTFCDTISDDRHRLLPTFLLRKAAVLTVFKERLVVIFAKDKHCFWSWKVPRQAQRHTVLIGMHWCLFSFLGQPVFCAACVCCIHLTGFLLFFNDSQTNLAVSC